MGRISLVRSRSPRSRTELGMSVRQLERLCREHVGLGPASLYRQLRMRYANWLIENTDRSVTEIAIEAGFADCAHFSRQFKDAYGLSPSTRRLQPDRALNSDAARARVFNRRNHNRRMTPPFNRSNGSVVSNANNRSLSRAVDRSRRREKWGVVHAHGVIFGRAASACLVFESVIYGRRYLGKRRPRRFGGRCRRPIHRAQPHHHER